MPRHWAPVDAIDAIVPPSVVVWQPPRAPEQIPRPEYMKVRQGFSTRKVKIEAFITMVITLLFVAVFVAAEGALMMLSLLLVATGLVRGVWLWAKARNRTRAIVNQ